jgi:hypothetical protein
MLALVGAAFILGKLHEPESRLGGEAPGWRVSLQTTSPGLVLATLGSMLIVCTIWARADVNVLDSALFLPARSFDLQPSSPSEQPKNGGSVQGDENSAIRKKAIESSQ